MFLLNPEHNQALQIHQGGRFIEKLFTDQNSQQFKLTFFVVLVNGEVKGKLISAQPMGKASSVGSEQVLYLPISLSVNETVTEYIPEYVPVVSPYNELFFFTSQPTRAPSISY
jgi:hypothetical protein